MPVVCRILPTRQVISAKSLPTLLCTANIPSSAFASSARKLTESRCATQTPKPISSRTPFVSACRSHCPHPLHSLIAMLPSLLLFAAVKLPYYLSPLLRVRIALRGTWCRQVQELELDR